MFLLRGLIPKNIEHLLVDPTLNVLLLLALLDIRKTREVGVRKDGLEDGGLFFQVPAVHLTRV